MACIKLPEIVIRMVSTIVVLPRAPSILQIPSKQSRCKWNLALISSGTKSVASSLGTSLLQEATSNRCCNDAKDKSKASFQPFGSRPSWGAPEIGKRPVQIPEYITGTAKHGNQMVLNLSSNPCVAKELRQPCNEDWRARYWTKYDLASGDMFRVLVRTTHNLRSTSHKESLKWQNLQAKNQITCN